MPPTTENVPGRDLTAERDARVIPAVRELLNAFAGRVDVPLGVKKGNNNEETAKYFQEMYKTDIVPLLLKHDLKLNEVGYLFQLLLQPIDLLRSVVNASLSMNRDLTDAKLYGLTDIDDLTVADLDRVLRYEQIKGGETVGGVGNPVDIVDKSE